VVPLEMQGSELLAGLPKEIPFADQHLLSAVELDVLTTFAAKRSPKLLTRCERFIHRASSREKAIVVSTPVEAWTTPLLPGRCQGSRIGPPFGVGLGLTSKPPVVARAEPVGRGQSGDGRFKRLLRRPRDGRE
jgi:hypothetical protein